jgi:hypothetical protein
MRIFSLIAVMVALTPACADQPASPPDGSAGVETDAATDAATDSASRDAAVNKTLLARVFELDPLTTPTPQLVQLSGLDDASGTLTSAMGPQGLRKLRVVSCVDEGATAVVPGAGTRRICTLKQLANRQLNGDFIYDDYKQGAASTFDPDDHFAEVSVYYHATRIYDFITSKEVGLFDHLPARHDVNGKQVPVTVVANHQQPASPSANALQPVGVASYIPREFGQMGLFAVNGLQGIEGDALVFGQGQRADFGYSGQAVYHEFGHLIFTALAGVYVYMYGDAYGLCHLTSALHEGVAETFAWLVSGRAQLGTYCNTESSGQGSYLRHAKNKATYPADISGLYLPDGQIVSGANYEIYQLLQAKAGLSAKRFARLLMKTFIALAPRKGKLSFRGYADELLEQLPAEGLKAHAGAVKQILTSRGLMDEARAKPITGFDGTNPAKQSLFTSGTGMGGSHLTIQAQGGGTLAVSPAYVQTYVDLPAGKTKLTVEALVRSTGMGGSPGGASGLDYRVYLRAGEPVAYDVTSSPVKVTRDAVHAPTMEQKTTSSGVVDLARWSLDQLKGGTRYYLHFVNHGAAQGALMAIKVTL